MTFKPYLLLPLFASVLIVSCAGGEENMLDAVIVTDGGTLNAIKSYTVPEDQPGVEPTELVYVFASFGQIGADAGTFTLNGVEIAKQQAGSVTSYNSSYDGQTFPDLKFDGSEHVFSVTGAESVPPLMLTVTSPEDFQVTAPESGPAIPRSKDLQVAWTGGSSSSTDSVAILLSNDGSNTHAYSVTALPNTGSHTIPSAQLTRFADTAVIVITKYRNARNTDNGKRFTAISEVRWAYPVVLE